MTQSELDNKVLALSERLIIFTNIAANMRASGDPYAEAVQHRQRFLLNVVEALREYDIDSDILSADDIAYTIELGTCAASSCSV